MSRLEVAEILLRGILTDYSKSGRKLVIKDLKKTSGLRDIPLSTISYYIDRIRQSGMEMPVFKYQRKKRS